jgi:hypothetical protein
LGDFAFLLFKLLNLPLLLLLLLLHFAELGGSLFKALG